MKYFQSEYQAEYDRSREFLREQLEPAAFEAAWAQGRVMNRKQVVAYLHEYRRPTLTRYFSGRDTGFLQSQLPSQNPPCPSFLIFS